MNEKLLNRISKNKLFENVDLEKIDFESIMGKLLSFAAGQLVFSEGDPSEYVYLIISGQVSVMKNTLLGKPEHASYLAADFFGMEELAEGTNRICTAVCTEDTYLIGLTKDEIQKLIDSDVQIQENIFKYSGLEKPESVGEHKEEPAAEIAQDEQPEISESEQTKPPVDSEDLESTNEPQIETETPTGEIEKTEPVEPNVIENINSSDLPAVDEEAVTAGNESYSGILDEAILPPIEEDTGEQNESVPAVTKREQSLPEQEALDNIEPPIEDLSNEFIAPPDIAEEEESFSSEQTAPDLDMLDNVAPPMDEETASVGDYPPEENLIDNVVTPPMEALPSEDIMPVVTPPIEENSQEQETHIEQEAVIEEQTETQKDFEKQKSYKEFVGYFTALLNAQNLSELNKGFELELAKLINAKQILLFTQALKDELFAVLVEGERKNLIKVALGKGIVGASAEVGEPIVIQDAVRDGRIYKEAYLTKLGQVNNLIAYPFISNDEHFVVLAVNFQKYIEEVEMELIKDTFEIYLSAREKIVALNNILIDERRAYAGRLVNYITDNYKSNTALIKNYANALLKKELGNEEKALANLIVESSQTIIEKTLFVSSITEDEIPFRFVEVSFSEQVDDFITSNKDYFDEKYCSIIKKIEDDAVVRIDPLYFRRVLWEIVKNSIEAMPFGGNLIFKIDLKGNKIKLLIQDNGKGIEQDNVDLVFEPFVAFGKENNSGLGLSFVRAVITGFKGQVNIESRVEKGTTVSITLPLVIS